MSGRHAAAPAGPPVNGAAGALEALSRAQAAWDAAQLAYETQLEQEKAKTTAAWLALPRNRGASPDALQAALDAVAASGECADDAPEKVQEFWVRQQALAEVLEEARGAWTQAVAEHKAQGLLRSQASRSAELAALRAVFPEYQPLAAGEDAEAQIAKLAGLLEHTVIGQELLKGQRELAGRVAALAGSVMELEAAAATAKQAAARPRWAASLCKADADLLLAARDADEDAAEAALAAGADVNCVNKVRLRTKASLRCLLVTAVLRDAAAYRGPHLRGPL